MQYYCKVIVKYEQNYQKNLFKSEGTIKVSMMNLNVLTLIDARASPGT